MNTRVLLLCLSPFLLCACIALLPLLIPIGLPLLLAYLAWQIWGPIRPPPLVLRSVPIHPDKVGAKEGAPRRNIKFADSLVVRPDGIETVPQLMRDAATKFGEHRCFGVRRVIKYEKKQVKTMVEGKEVEKTHTIPWMSDYEWRTINEVMRDIKDFGFGITRGTSSPLEFDNTVAIYASTRPEWQISAQACMTHGLVVTTCYPTLGVEALAFSLNQTKVSHIITEAALLETVVSTRGQLKGFLKVVVYMDELPPAKHQEYQKSLGCQLISWNEVLEKGRNLALDPSTSSNHPIREPRANDRAVLMYTSGSTGRPKAIEMTHGNLIAAATSIKMMAPTPIDESDVFLAYLPLAHVLELAAEICIMSVGASIGYGSPQTIRDDGCYDESGKPAGDISKLRPTIFVAVPMILDRIRAGIEATVKKGGIIQKALFQLCYRIKLRRYLSGQQSPILDKILFKKIAAKFGGRLKYIVSGGAPLSPATHQFIEIVTCAQLMQGFGLTETGGGGTVTDPNDRLFGNAGVPIACCQIKLVDEPEMGYTHLDKPHPRGQIYIGGANVTLGYYDNPELTAESFFVESAETSQTGGPLRWFATGDIGEWEENGTLKIIDRKKDLTKLKHGEYIALGNLESKYSHCPLVDNICVVGDSHHSAPVALVAVNHEKLIELANNNGISHTNNSVHALCSSPDIQRLVKVELDKVAQSNKMPKWEKLAAVHLCPEAWTPQSGLLTDAMKLKRHAVQAKYKDEIARLYKNVD